MELILLVKVLQNTKLFYKIVLIRYISILIIMVLNMFKIYNKEYRLFSIISLLSIITLLNWPNNIKEIEIYIINIIIGYKINISYNYIGLFFSLFIPALF